MRITTAEKAATRERIIAAALDLFRTKGFEATTTRDISQASQIASGTLFNYFDRKESIVLSLASDCLTAAWDTFRKEQVPADLEEALFALVAAELRQLEPLRKFILPLLETSLSPLAVARRDDGEKLRTGHLELVVKLVRDARDRVPGYAGGEVSPVALQVYWSLYVGVLAFWAGDQSPKQEDTLALLDESMAMFVAWLDSSGASERKASSCPAFPN